MPGGRLTAAAKRALAEAGLALQHSAGFVYLPVLAQSQRAAAQALAVLGPALPTQVHRVAWPLPEPGSAQASADASSLNRQLQGLLEHLDESLLALPAGSGLVLDATGGDREALALMLPVALNQRRESFRQAAVRLLVLWPAPLREELMAGAPDLWSMRAAAPWVDEEPQAADVGRVPADGLHPRGPVARPAGAVRLAPQWRQRFERLAQGATLQEADLSEADALAFVEALGRAGLWAEAATLAEQLLRLPAVGPSLLPWRADLCVWLDLARRELGDRLGALAPARQAVDIYQELAHAHPVQFEPQLVGALNNLAIALSEVGDRQGGLEHAQQAVELARRLSMEDPQAHEPTLGRSWLNLAGLLGAVGDLSGATAAAQAAVAAFRSLSQSDPVSHAADLAASLGNLASFSSLAGDSRSALTFAREALEITRRLHHADPREHTADLASSLSGLANELAATGDYGGAVVLAQESLGLRRWLVQHRSTAHEPDLAAGLNNLAACLQASGDALAALEPAGEAVAINRRLAQAREAVHAPDLARSLWTLARVQAETGELAAARQAGEESLRLYRQLAQRLPAVFEPLYKAVAHQLEGWEASPVQAQPVDQPAPSYSPVPPTPSTPA